MKMPYESEEEAALGITIWDRPEARMKTLIYECPECKCDHSISRPPSCYYRGMNRKVALSCYGNINYRQWCELEQKRLGETVVIDSRTNPDGVEMICLRRKA